MKKKIIWGILIILVSILSIIMFYENHGKVQEFTFVKIADSYGKEIKEYNKNLMPFTIEGKEDVTITVNGKKYEPGKRLYKPGKYKVIVKNADQIEKSTIVINQVVKKEEHEYSIYATTQTLQTLFANLNVAQNPNLQGFFWTARDSTTNIEKVKENISNLEMSKYNGETEEEKIRQQVIPEMKQYVQNVLQKDPNAYFHLYTEEDRFYLELELFGKIGLDDSRYDVTMYTNGTLGYVRQYEIAEENKYEQFVSEKERYMTLVNGAKEGKEDFNEHPEGYPLNENSIIFNMNYNYDYTFLSTLRENITYKTQFPELITFKDDKIAKEMEKANIEKISAKEEFNNLSEESKKIFFENINFDKAELDNKYFQTENSKYLIITGTVPFYGNMNKENFEIVIKKVAEQYKKEYQILYKPHPREIPNQDQTEFLESLNIKILPGKLPMESILFIYPDVKIGGFSSSLYLSAEKGQVEFFFERKKEDLVEPLNQLYDQLFSTAKFWRGETNDFKY